MRLAFAACAFAVAGVATTAAARAADSVYWTNHDANTVSFANLDGSGGFGNLATDAPVAGPEGVAIDPAGGRIYWANEGSGTIAFADIDGSHGGTLNTTGATVNLPFGVAIDAAHGRVYWANEAATSAPGISFARLDGTGGGNLNTGTATINHPVGVAIDPDAGKIYWANRQANKISFAFLDGSGGGDLATTGATVIAPQGVALDQRAGRIYWADETDDKISFANLDGVGGGDVITTGATVDVPSGVAVDPIAGKIFWANLMGGQVSFARLDGSGGGDLDITGSHSMNASFPALLEGPSAAAAPVVTGGGATPTTLGCTQGIWGPDLRASLLYRAPRSFTFSWLKDGAPVTGAAGSLLDVRAPGSYRCRVTAVNLAGATTQMSAPFAVADPPAPPPPPPPPTATATAVSTGFAVSVTVTCHGVSGQTCAGTMRVKSIVRRPGGHGATVGTGAYRVAAGRSVTVRIELNRAGGRLLARRLVLPTTLTFRGTSAPPRIVTFRLARVHVQHQLIVWRIFIGAYTTAFSLTLSPVPAGASVTVECSGRGCPFARRRVHAHGTRLSLTRLFGAHRLRPGATVTFAITAPGRVGEVLRYALDARPTIPKPRILCAAPGARRAVGCPGPAGHLRPERRAFVTRPSA
jgi:DNA-binding beta-propeller fold protein YncE